MTAAREPCRILVPVHRPLTQSEEDIVRHNLATLADHPASLVGPRSRRRDLDALASSLSAATGSEIGVETFADRWFADVAGYSALLISRRFYRRFRDVDYVLICQTDALVLSGDLGPWLGEKLSFVGAPLFKGYWQPAEPLEFDGTMNGGLSLRRVADALRALDGLRFLRRSRPVVRKAEKYGLIAAANRVLRVSGIRLVVWQGDEHEDLVWTKLLPAMGGPLVLPPPETAARFAFEVRPRHLHALIGRLPFGVHAFARYDPEFWMETLGEDLAALVRAAVAEADARQATGDDR